MHKFIATIAISIALLSLTMSGPSAAQVPAQKAASADASNELLSSFAHEAVAIKLEPGWTLANKVQNGNAFILQFLPPGDTAQNIHKLINVCTYAGLQQTTSARQFMMENKKSSQKFAAKGQLDWKVVSDDSPGDVTFEYSVKGVPGTPDQYEMQRVIQGKDGLHAAIYHLAKAEVTPSERQHMLDWLKTVSLQAPQKPAAK